MGLDPSQPKSSQISAVAKPDTAGASIELQKLLDVVKPMEQALRDAIGKVEHLEIKSEQVWNQGRRLAGEVVKKDASLQQAQVQLAEQASKWSEQASEMNRQIYSLSESKNQSAADLSVVTAQLVKAKQDSADMERTLNEELGALRNHAYAQSCKWNEQTSELTAQIQALGRQNETLVAELGRTQDQLATSRQRSQEHQALIISDFEVKISAEKALREQQTAVVEQVTDLYSELLAKFQSQQKLQGEQIQKALQNQRVEQEERFKQFESAKVVQLNEARQQNEAQRTILESMLKESKTEVSRLKSLNQSLVETSRQEDERLRQREAELIKKVSLLERQIKSDKKAAAQYRLETESETNLLRQKLQDEAKKCAVLEGKINASIAGNPEKECDPEIDRLVDLQQTRELERGRALALKADLENCAVEEEVRLMHPPESKRIGTLLTPGLGRN